MRDRIRVGVAFLTLVLAAVVTAVATPGATASATPPATRLVVRVDGCSSCTLTLARAFSGTDIYWRSRGKKVGSDHEVVFHLPTKRTRGLSFELAVPWQDYTGAVLNVVTRDAGQSAGERRNAREAKAAGHAFGCWAGTKREKARLHFHVARFAFNGGRSTGAVAWASRGLRSLQPRARAWHGSIGNQEIFYCS